MLPILITGGLTVLFLGAVAVAGRRAYQRFAAAFPEPQTPPHIGAVDRFQATICFLRIPASAAETGGSGHRVEVGEEGFRIAGGSLFTGGHQAWFPWERVAQCEAVSGIDPSGDYNPPGTRVMLMDNAALLSLADPAGDRVLGFWRLYLRRTGAG